jgi:hypothetical protein
MENKQSETHHQQPSQPQPSSDDKPNVGPHAIPNPNRDDENLACYAFAKSQDAKMEAFLARIQQNK